MKGAKVIDCSGSVNKEEVPENSIDGNEQTKWCDVSPAPNYVVYDMGESKLVSGWKLVNAGIEDGSYITRSCLLQGRNSLNEEWKTLDILEDNHNDVVTRTFTPDKVRYVRLYVIGPTQEISTGDTRIYELKVY